MISQFFWVKCVSAQEENIVNQTQIPEWVLNPMVENGLSATGCQNLGGNILHTKRIAQNQALVQLASQIEMKVSTMDKEYQMVSDKSVKSTDEQKATAKFTSVSKQLLDQTLSNVQVDNIAKVNFANQAELADIHLCVQLTLRPSSIGLPVVNQQLKN
jgi:hypothetical protein